MNSRRPLTKRAAFITALAGFIICLMAKCGYWSLNWETGSINLPNWLRIRYLVFYLLPLLLLLAQFGVNRGKTGLKVQGFYIFACVLMAAQAAVKTAGYLKMEDRQLIACMLEGIVFAGFLACAVESQQQSEGRKLPLFILGLVCLIHVILIVKDTLPLLHEAENGVKLGVTFFLSETALLYFDAAAILDLIPVHEKKKALSAPEAEEVHDEIKPVIRAEKEQPL